MKLPSPLYTALTGWLSTDRPAVEIWAWPPLRITGLPKSTPSILNWIVPVRVPAPGALTLTVAVKVTLCPNTDGLTELDTAVEALALLTTCPPVSTPVEPLKLPSPLYTALTGWLPTDRPAVEIWAWPPLRVTGLPKSTPSILNWTVPVRVPAPGASTLTVAVKVTLCPNTDGFTELDTAVDVFALLTVMSDCVPVTDA